MENLRETAKNSIGKYSKFPKNINLIEKKIFELSKKENDENYKGNIENDENYKGNIEENYKEILYQILYLFSTGNKSKEIMTILKENKVNYNHDDFLLVKEKQKEFDDYLNNPFQVKKGLLTCEKCKSDKTMSYFKQDRGGDEGTSVYSQCLKCKYKWRVNN